MLQIRKKGYCLQYPFFLYIFVISTSYTMAVIQMGALVTGIKGKIGGTVFGYSATGHWAKELPYKLTKADSGRAMQQKTLIASVSGQWRSLTDEQRQSWNTGAVSYPALTKFGHTYTPSGYQVFMKLNSQVYKATGILLTDCPVPVTVGEMPNFAIAMPEEDEINLTWSDSLPSNCRIMIEATHPLGQAIKPKNSFFKQIGTLSVGQTSPQNLDDNYQQLFGYYPEGCRVWFRFTVISIVTGQKGVPFTFSVIPNFS